MPGHGHRYMYYATGLPGWMRFGFSPGWSGVSPTGMGPGATYLTSGTWPTPQAQNFWQAMQMGQAPYPGYEAMAPGYFSGAGAQPSKEQQLQFLHNQAENLKTQMEEIKKQIDELAK